MDALTLYSIFPFRLYVTTLFPPKKILVGSLVSHAEDDKKNLRSRNKSFGEKRRHQKYRRCLLHWSAIITEIIMR